ncbi:MAG: ATP-binding cassette subfamily B protein [Granulosicoccus sp.]|jgi:ATP-binding cassette subfamily B protein
MKNDSPYVPDQQATPNKAGLTMLTGLWPFLQPYRWVLFLAILSLVLTAGLNLSLGQGVRLIVDDGFVGGSLSKLNTILWSFLSIVILLSLGTFARFYLVTWLGERVTADIRKAVFNHLITLEPNYFETNRSGELMSRLTTDTSVLQSIIGSSISFALRSLLLVVGGLFMLLITNVKLTLVVFAALPIIILPVLFFGKRVRKLSRASQDSVADVGTYAGEILQQIKTVQSYTREENERNAFAKEVENAFFVAKQRIMNRGLLTALVILFAFSAIGVMVYVGAKDVLLGNMSGGELAAFIFYAVMVAGGIAAVSEVLGELQRAAGATERLLELLSVSALIRSPNSSETDMFHEANRYEILSLDNHSCNHIEFNNVKFSYPSRPDFCALDDINLVIKQGETIALVGSSGAGKSTLFELLQRFYDPQVGEIQLHNVSLRQLDLHSARRQMALVPQQPILFSADVMHNIRYGNPDASDEEVIAAAKAAYAHDFIIQLPDQYHSFLGENGVRLSGGQKQRVVIARAILNDPDILLLDEATSALDSESERWVQKALNKLMKKRTTLIIAHRLATVVHADRIIVMENGRMIAEGSHQQLLASSPKYQTLAALQFGHQDK